MMEQSPEQAPGWAGAVPEGHNFCSGAPELSSAWSG